MNKIRIPVAVISLLAAGLGSAAFGQARGRMYDTKTVETISGEVVAVNRIAPGRGRAGGVHLMVKTDKEEIAVHLGPQWYVDQQAVRLGVKDHVEVRGSRISVDGKPVLIAAELKKGNQVLKLRDDAGLPLWRGKGGQKS